MSYSSSTQISHANFDVDEMLKVMSMSPCLVPRVPPTSHRFLAEVAFMGTIVKVIVVGVKLPGSPRIKVQNPLRAECLPLPSPGLNLPS
jgi:hypothetical protein